MNPTKEVHITLSHSDGRPKEKWVQVQLSPVMHEWFRDYPSNKWYYTAQGVIIDEEMYLLWVLKWKYNEH